MAMSLDDAIVDMDVVEPEGRPHDAPAGLLSDTQQMT